MRDLVDQISLILEQGLILFCSSRITCYRGKKGFIHAIESYENSTKTISLRRITPQEHTLIFV